MAYFEEVMYALVIEYSLLNCLMELGDSCLDSVFLKICHVLFARAESSNNPGVKPGPSMGFRVLFDGIVYAAMPAANTEIHASMSLLCRFRHYNSLPIFRFSIKY